MYRHCIFCTAPLGANQAVERFPVGARLAFDAARGRLWAICPRCGRWNLAPIAERWEAVEEAERCFHGTPLRVQHENVGIAHVASGASLVRVGRAPHGELAAWRYGPELRKRHRRHRVIEALNVIGAVLVGLWIPTGFLLGRQVVLAPDGRPLRLAQMAGARFTRDAEGLRLQVEPRGRGWASVPPVSLAAGDAERVLGRVLTAVNHRGADDGLLRHALDHLDRAGSADGYLERLGGAEAAAGGAWSLELRSASGRWCLGVPGERTRGAPAPAMAEPRSLALEMALHEQAERAALDGELRQLARAWREAEEIAAIADALP